MSCPDLYSTFKCLSSSFWFVWFVLFVHSGSSWCTWCCCCNWGFRVAQDKKPPMGYFQNLCYQGRRTLWGLGLVNLVTVKQHTFWHWFISYQRFCFYTFHGLRSSYKSHRTRCALLQDCCNYAEPIDKRTSKFILLQPIFHELVSEMS